MFDHRGLRCGVFICLAVLTLLSAAAEARTFDYRLTHSIRHQQRMESQPDSWLVYGDLMYVGRWSGQPYLQVFDRSVPGGMRVVHETPTPIFPGRLHREGTRLLGVDDDGVIIMDVSAPAEPVLLGDVEVSSARSAALVGELLYVTRYDDGLAIFDVSDPADPIAVNEVELDGSATLITVMGSRAVVNLGWNGFVMLDLQDPRHPEVLGGALAHAGIRQFLHVGDLLAVACSIGGTHFYNVHDAGFPIWVAGYNPGVQCMGIAATDERLYVARSDDSLEVLDISNLPTLSILHRHEHLPDASGVALQGDLLQIWLYTKSFAWIDPGIVAESTEPLFELPCDGTQWTMTVRDGLLYGGYSASEEGFRIVDVSPGGAGEILADVPLGNRPIEIELRGDLAYLPCIFPPALVIMDISQPTAPTVLSNLPLLGCADVSLRDHRAYVALDLPTSGGVAVVDVSDPEAPVLESTLALPDRVEDVEVWGEYLVGVTESDGLYVLGPDGTDGSRGSLSVVSFLAWSHTLAVDMKLQGDLAYVLTYTDLYVVDLSRPDDPVIVGSWQCLNSNGHLGSELVVQGDLGYLSSYTNDVTLLDLQDPTQPRLIGFTPSTEGALGLAVDQHGIYCAHDGGGITAWPAYTLTTTTRGTRPTPSTVGLKVFPCPANPRTSVSFELAQERELEIAVYDLRGARVATLGAGSYGTGRHLITWDGRGRDGTLVPSGVYLVRVAGEGVEQARRLTLVR